MCMNRKNILKAFLFLYVVIFLSSACKTRGVRPLDGQSAQTSLLDKIIEDGVLRVGTTGDFKPFSYHKGNASAFHGMDITMAKDLANSLGVKVSFVKTSWPTLMEDLRNDKFDIAMSGISIKLDRQKIGLFSIPILEGGKAPICRVEDAERFVALDSINQPDVRVIFNPGGTNEAFARAHFPKATLIKNEDNITVFQRIVDHEADVMVTDEIETRIQEKIHPELKAVKLDKPFGFFEMAYLLPRDVVWKAYVDQWLHLREKQGLIDSILEEELGKLMK